MKPRYLLILVFVSVLFTACKGDDIFGDTQPNTDRVIAEFKDAKNGSSVTNDYSTQPVEVDLTELRLDPRSKVKGEIKVRISLKPGIVGGYNSTNGTAYQVPDGASLSLPETEFVLTQKERSKMIKAKIQPSGFVNGSYAVGLTIAGMSEGEISSVGKEIIVFISIKNEFDGVYSLKGYSDIPGTAFTGNFSLPCSEELWAVTSGTSSIYLDPAQAVFNNGSFTYITNVLPEFVIDKTSYKVTAVNARPGSLGFVYPFDASYNSHYDPNSKTLYVKYGIVPSGSGRTIIDTLTYCKAR